VGTVRLLGLPAQASVFVDDAEAARPGGGPLSLPVGRHELRVETATAVLFSDSIDVRPGEQTVAVGRKEP
jgi:hypothetical protein